MANPVQHRDWISKIRLQRAMAALTFVALLGPSLVASVSAEAQTFTVLHNFTGAPDGALSESGLVRDKAGTLYGTTLGGGDSSCNSPNGCGVVFKVEADGDETVLHSFTGGSDGAYPQAGLVRDTMGNLYGTAEEGGASGDGTVFEISPRGKETVLYAFMGGAADGCYPFGGLVRDKVGNLYGTTNECGSTGYGTVFRISHKNGKETVLHSFTGSDGAYPYLTSLILDGKGNLFGVAVGGGNSMCGGNGCGTVYELSRSGKFTVLYTFTGGTSDGCGPSGIPTIDTDGNLYGTTSNCGSSGYGTTWKLNKSGKETVLHSFAGAPSDGSYPLAGVIRDAKGNLYGDTSEDGASDDGTVYELSEKGALTLLHSFVAADGAGPFGDLTRDTAGRFYSTSSGGGSGNYGTVFKLTP